MTQYTDFIWNKPTNWAFAVSKFGTLFRDQQSHNLLKWKLKAHPFQQLRFCGSISNEGQCLLLLLLPRGRLATQQVKCCPKLMDQHRKNNAKQTKWHQKQSRDYTTMECFLVCWSWKGNFGKYFHSRVNCQILMRKIFSAVFDNCWSLNVLLLLFWYQCWAYLPHILVMFVYFTILHLCKDDQSTNI